jgi:hypothetical protein
MRLAVKRVATGAAAAALLGLAFAAGPNPTYAAPAGGTSAVDQVRPMVGYRHVTADSLTLWNAASGGSGVGTWTWGQCFYEEGIEGDNRYRTHTESGAVVWVSADPRWSAPGC